MTQATTILTRAGAVNDHLAALLDICTEPLLTQPAIRDYTHLEIMNLLYKGVNERWGLFGNRYGLGDPGNHERHEGCG